MLEKLPKARFWIVLLIGSIAIAVVGLYIYDRLVPPAGQRLVATRNGEICIMSSNGGHSRCLVDGNNPRWSPNGKEIAFEFYDARTNRTHLSVIGIDEGNSPTFLLDDRIAEAPSWSPDGRSIIVGSGYVYVVDVGTRTLHQVTSQEYHFVQPDWSPDGTKIVFSASQGSITDSQIYTMNVDGSGLECLTTPPAQYGHPRWSPDGAKIVFESTLDALEQGGADIYVMNADGSNVIRLTRDPAVDFFPVWSPNGKQIAFLSNRDRRTTRPLYSSVELDLFQIYVMDGDGNNTQKITHDWFATYESIDWSAH